MNQTTNTSQHTFASAMELAGMFVLHPGCPPGITGQRPVLKAGLLPRLLQNLQTPAIAQRLGQLFNLCGHAHRLAATLALETALKTPANATQHAERAQYLCWQTVREHMQRIALEWPVQFGVLLHRFAPPKLDWSKAPLWQEPAVASNNAAQLYALNQWLQAQGMLNGNGQACGVWQEYLQTLFECLRSLLPQARVQPLQSAHIAQAAQALADHPDFTFYPQIQGKPHETGAWARLESQPMHADASTRVQARWLEVEHLLAGEKPLHFGSGHAGAGVYAYVEMSRGLLLHWLHWDTAKKRVVDYRVLAPTEWNFHPHGALAQALRNVPGSGNAQEIQKILAMAYALDPCTVVSVQNDGAKAQETMPSLGLQQQVPSCTK